LNKFDAARIEKLLLEAERLGIDRKVYYFNKQKTLADIKAYTRKRKSANPFSCGQLPEIPDSDTLPGYITVVENSVCEGSAILPYVATPSTSSNTGRNSLNIGTPDMQTSPFLQPSTSVLTPGTSVTSSPAWKPTDLIFQQDHQQSSFIEDPLPPSAAYTGGLQQEDDHHFNSDEKRQSWGLQYESLSVDASQVGLENALELVKPLLSLQSPGPIFAPNAYITAAMSVTPPETFRSFNHDQSLFEDLSTIMRGGVQEETLTSRGPSAQFLLGCVQFCISRSRRQDEDAPVTFTPAMDAFEEMLKTDLDNSLPVLGNMIAIFECYGQRYAAREILAGVLDCVSRCSRPNAITKTIQFMCQTQVPEYGEKGQYDIEDLYDICEEFKSLQNPSYPKLVLIARYNIAWAELETQNNDKARSLLYGLKSDTETIFGERHLQTIMVNATLSRANLRCGRLLIALGLIEEEVIAKVSEMFSKSNAYYYQARHRQGIFMLKLSQTTEDAYRKQSYRDQAEKILREVVLWRMVYLGNNNPRTDDTFCCLKELLEDDENTADQAKDLSQWCFEQSQAERQRIWGHHFTLTRE
jgi:hypothetical protein